MIDDTCEYVVKTYIQNMPYRFRCDGSREYNYRVFLGSSCAILKAICIMFDLETRNSLCLSGNRICFQQGESKLDEVTVEQIFKNKGNKRKTIQNTSLIKALNVELYLGWPCCHDFEFSLPILILLAPNERPLDLSLKCYTAPEPSTEGGDGVSILTLISACTLAAAEDRVASSQSIKDSAHIEPWDDDASGNYQNL